MTGPILCPHCEEVTLPNRLVDGTVICSCAAGRRLDGGGAAADREDGSRTAAPQSKLKPPAAR